MAQTLIVTINQNSSITLPLEALEALGVQPGAELDIEIIGGALVVRSIEESNRSQGFTSAFDSIVSKRTYS